MRSRHVKVEVDLERIRANVRAIRQQVRAGVDILAVVKADAYGAGAGEVATAIGGLVDGFCVFSLAEALAVDLWNLTHKPVLAIGPPETLDAQEYLQQHVRPAVSNVEQARALRAASPVVCVDTGMQRFACPAEHVAAVCEAGGCGEVFTHATKLAQVEQLLEITRGMNVRRHASGSAQLGYAEAQLDAVRPGFALYRDAIRVTAPLVEARQTRGPAGYSGFSAARHGVIIAGYSNGLRVGPCLINGMPRRILEVGMQSSYVELGDTDSVGDQVVLLGDGLSEAQVAKAWGTSPHEALLRLASMGTRQYSPPEPIA